MSGGPTERRGRRWRRVLVLLAALLVLIGLAFAGRAAILSAIGRVLIREDALHHADVIYALGGSPMERGREAARLLKEGHAPIMACTGGNSLRSVEIVLGHEFPEAYLTRMAAIEAGADSARVFALTAGTSTWEEAGLLRSDALSRQADTIIVVTTEFHTRRVSRVFRDRFKGSGITVIVRAAKSLDYDAQRWWASEEGLIMVNNEYMKLLYYRWRY